MGGKGKGLETQQKVTSGLKLTQLNQVNGGLEASISQKKSLKPVRHFAGGSRLSQNST